MTSVVAAAISPMTQLNASHPISPTAMMIASHTMFRFITRMVAGTSGMLPRRTLRCRHGRAKTALVVSAGPVTPAL
jgi:hypothetical protein